MVLHEERVILQLALHSLAILSRILIWIWALLAAISIKPSVVLSHEKSSAF